MELEERKDVGPYGNIIAHEFYSRDGKLEHVRKLWYSNDNLKEISFWKNGHREGKCFTYRLNGKLWSRGLFRDGISLEFIMYGTDGKIEWYEYKINEWYECRINERAAKLTITNRRTFAKIKLLRGCRHRYDSFLIFDLDGLI
jgi:antitoxin component YwqK of YwqJK toxin-antitoxin module